MRVDFAAVFARLGLFEEFGGRDAEAINTFDVVVFIGFGHLLSYLDSNLLDSPRRTKELSI